MNEKEMFGLIAELGNVVNTQNEMINLLCSEIAVLKKKVLYLELKAMGLTELPK